jgi:hypothetical protein
MELTPPLSKDGTRLFNFHQVAKICGIGKQTIHRYASGQMPVQIDFNLQRVPVTKHRNRKRVEPPPQNPRHFRTLIPEDRVYALREMVDNGLTKIGSLSREETLALEAIARRFSVSSHFPPPTM